jgi:protein CpxP
LALLLAIFTHLYIALSARNVPVTYTVHTWSQADSDFRLSQLSKDDPMKPVFKSLIVAGLLATAGFAAYSQNPGSMMGHDGGHMGRMDPAKMEQMVAKHMADLKTKLKITPAQEGAWTTFTAAMKPSGAMSANRPDRAEMDKLTTPERIDKMQALHTQRMADMNTEMTKRNDATKTFYATLTGEQKKVFDAEHAKMGDRHGFDKRGDKGGMQDHKGHAADKGAMVAPKK